MVVGDGRTVEQARTLAEIVQQQAGEDERVPGKLDRPAPEMPHIGKERLDACDGKHHRPEDEDHPDAVGVKKLHGVEGIDRPNHDGMGDNPDQTRRTDGDEPDDHDRPEDPAYAGGAAALEQKKQEEEFEKLEESNELRQSGNAVNVNVKTAVGKASAETGKSYGNE